MPVDGTTGKFIDVVTHDLNTFLNELIYNTGALYGLKITGLGDWIYTIAPNMRGEVYDSMREAIVIGGVTELKRLLIRQGWSLDFMLYRF
mmetsp:Transcript_50906/g.90966  ORF Transcript_50906/g.90966 Transcript_50906/m.90966 type:complete len:90 (+) Transcript_50906:2445-2714(+)